MTPDRNDERLLLLTEQTRLVLIEAQRDLGLLVAELRRRLREEDEDAEPRT